MELVDGDQAVVERLDAQFLDRETEGRMRADQHPFVALVAGQELLHRLDLGLGDARLVDARRVAQVPLRRDRPVPVGPVLRQGFIGEAAADRSLRIVSQPVHHLDTPALARLPSQDVIDLVHPRVRDCRATQCRD